MRALITGSAGFVGSHLAGYLLGLNWELAGFDLRASPLTPNFSLGELTDRAAVRKTLDAFEPQIVVHLAGVIKSNDPKLLFDANLMGTTALLDEIVASNPHIKVVITSSSAVYGANRSEDPIRESARLHPLTMYAASKAAQEMLALRYFDSMGLSVSIVRMFNLLGAGQSADLACSSFARQIALAERGGTDEISTGSLHTRRDFVDVRDAVRAIALVAEHGKAGQIYNICSGNAVRMSQCLQAMMSMSARPLKVRVETSRIQQNDIPMQVGDPQKLRRAVGWRPQIRLKQSLADLLGDWRQRVKLEAEP